MVAWQALIQVYQGQWDDAGNTAAELLQSPNLSALSRMVILVALGRLRARRGDPGVWEVLDAALELARQTNTIQRLAPVHAARAEAAWIAGERAQALAEAQAAYDLAAARQHPWFGGELAFWRWRTGDELAPLPWLAPPFALQVAGDWQGAAAAWQQLGCPYEQARALADGDQRAQIAALDIFSQLGALPAVETLRQRMRAAGVAAVPRGPRAATRDNLFGLTTRQLDILALLTQNLTNAEIAGRLYLSPKTVDHHVSAVLAKLGVHSREAAAEVARQHPLPTSLK
jgi:DNA-binding CsgD family transcriptional regulator